MPGLSSKIKEKLNAKKEEVKERVNPFSSTNKKARQEHREERQKEQKVEHEAYKKERAHQIEERGKRTAQREYAPPSKTRSSSIRRSAGPNFVPVNARDPFGVFGQSKPKPRPQTKTTTVKTSDGKTVTIKENVSQEEKKKAKPQWQFQDPLALDGFGGSEPAEKKNRFRDPFAF
jgi:hypothetical protein